jgi:hypothetical protein
MAETFELFENIVAGHLDKVSGDPALHNKIQKEFLELTNFQPHTLFRPDSMNLLFEQIFKDESVRQLYTSILFQFYLLAGTGQNYLHNLCLTLEDALTVDGPLTEKNVLPNVFSTSMPLVFYRSSYESWTDRLISWVTRDTRITVAEFLLNNKIVVIALLMQLIPKGILSIPLVIEPPKS